MKEIGAWVKKLGALICLALTVFFLFGVYQEQKRLSWPTVWGRIDDVRIVESSSGYTTDRVGRRSQRLVKRAEVTFSYSVQGKIYSGVSPLSQSSWNFQAGEPIKIYYDPSNPKEATSNPGGGIGLLVGAVGSFFVAMSLILSKDKSNPLSEDGTPPGLSL